MIKRYIKDFAFAAIIMLSIFWMSTAFSMLAGGTFVSAKEEVSGSTSDLIVSGYKVTRGGNKTTGKIANGYKATIVVDLKQDGITAQDVGKITATATSSSFRLPKDSISVEIVSKKDAPLTMKMKLSDIVYKGVGDSINFKLNYSNGSTNEGNIHIYECVETEKPYKESSSGSSDDGKNKHETHYGAPPILITKEPTDILTPGQEFNVKIKLQNLSPRITASDLMVSVEASDGLILLGDTSTRYIRGLAAKQNEIINVKLRANKQITNPSQSLQISVKYNFFENDQRTAATTDQKLILAFDPDTIGKNDVATPNIIISKYDYGDRLAVGDTAELTLQLQNTNQDVAVENLVMTLETGEGITVANSSNTFYIPILEAGGTLTRIVELKALSVMQGSKPDYKLDVNFKYEYMAGDKRTPVTSGEKLGISVYQPDRFQISPPTLTSAVEGEETTISFAYVNKGLGSVSNVEAELSGDINMLNSHQNLGNFEAGKSGTVDFVITPKQAGNIELNAKITYEDGNMKPKTLDLPVKLTITEAATPDMTPPEIMEPTTPEYGWVIWAVSGGCILLLVILLIYRNKVKKRRQENCLALAWKDDEVKIDETA